MMMSKALFLSFLLCLFFTDAHSEQISFEGIAMGQEATRLMQTFKINPEDATGWSSDESCDRIAAKAVIRCVWRVATCKARGGAYCPPDDDCISEYRKSERAILDEQCRSEEVSSKIISNWAEKQKHVALPRQIVCYSASLYRRVVNAFLDGNAGPLKSSLGFGCKITETSDVVKILGKSKDGKLYHIQYIVPYSSDFSEGWISSKGIVTKKAYLKTKY